MSVFHMIRKKNKCKKSLKTSISISIMALMFMVFCFPSTVKAASIGDVVTEVANNNISSPEFDFGTEDVTGLNLKAHMARGDYANGESMIAVVGPIDESQMKTIIEHIAEVAGSTGVKTTSIKGGEVREYTMTDGIGITVVLPDYLVTVEIYETGNNSSGDIATAKKFAQQLVNGLDKNGLLSQPAPDIQQPVSDNKQSGQEKESSNTPTGVVVKGKALEEAAAVSNTDNIAGVKNGPTAPTTFTINVPHLVTYIRDYHWNNAKGDTPGTIALKDQNGVVYGPWQAKGTDGMGGVKNANWEVYPNVVIPAGTYTIIDSNPATWSQNQESSGRGMGQVKATPHFQVTSGSLNDLEKTASENIDKSGSSISEESPAGVGSVGKIPGPENSTEAVVGVAVPGVIATVLAGLAGLGGGVIPPGGAGISGGGPIPGGGVSFGGAGGSTGGAASPGETIPQQGRTGSTSSSGANEVAQLGRRRRKTDSYSIEEPEILINEDEGFNEFVTTENIIYSQEPISISVDDGLIIEDGLSKDQDLIIEESLTEENMGNELKTGEDLIIEEGIGIEIEDGLIIEDGLEIDDGLQINKDFGKNESIESEDGLIIEKDFGIKDSEAAGKEYDAQGFDSAGDDKEGFNKAGFDEEGYDKNGYNSEGYDRQGFDVEGYDRDGFNSQGYDKEGFNKAGFDEEGYDKNGYNSEGFNRQGFDGEGYDRDGFNSQGYDKEGFNKAGFDEEGYDRDGYNSKGYDRQGFDDEGYDRGGFNSEGYDKEGFNEAGFNEEGYDRNGYDSEGYDRKGFDVEGYDRDGFNSEGYDKEGFNEAGFDKEGYDRNGYDSEGYDREGFDVEGYDGDGFNSDGYDKEGFNEAGFDKDGYDRNGYDSESYDRQGFDVEGYDRDGFNSEGYDKKGFNEAGFDKEGYNRNGFNLEGYDREGFDINGMNKKGYNRSGYDVEGYNAAGYDREGFNRQGFDKDGYGRNGLSKDGFDREGYDKEGYDKNGYDKNGYNREGYSREDLDEYGYGKDGFNKDDFDKDGYDRQGFDYEGYNRDGYDPWGYNRQGYDKDGYHWSGYNSEGYNRNGKHWSDIDYDPERRNPFDGGPISLNGSPIKDEAPKAPPLGQPYPKTAEKYGPKPWTTEPSSSKTEPAVPSSGDKIPSVSTADEGSTITPEPPESDSGIIGPEDPMNTLKHHGTGEEGKESGLPIPEEDIPESDTENIQTSSDSTSVPESSDIQQEAGKIPETPQAEEVPQEPESMVITTSVHGAQTLVVKDTSTGQWVDSETGAVIDLEAHQKNLEQQIKDYQDYIQRNDELEKTGQSAMQQALDKIKKDSKAEIDAIQKEIDKRNMEQLKWEQQHLEWEQQQAEKANSWGSILAHTAANAGKDIVETAKDVKDAAVYIADTTAEAGSDLLQTAKNIWEGGFKGAVQNIQDAYVGTQKVVNDTYEGTKKALKEAEEAAEDTVSYIYNNPEEAWENTKTATIETGKTILKTGAAITKGVYNTVTDPEKVWEFAKEQLGGNNFENALDPNRSLTSRIGQVLVGTGKLYTSILTLGQGGAVIKSGAGKISGVVDDLIGAGAKKTGLVDDVLGAAAKKTGGKAAVEASDDVMKASIAKAQKEARYKVESAKINVQAKEASKKADSLIDDFKKYEKQTMETNLKDEAFVKAQKAGAEKVDKLKDASIKLAENPNSAEAKQAYKKALEAVEKDKHAMKKIEDLRDEAFWKGREEGAKKVDKLREAQKNLVHNPDSAEARKAYQEAMEAVQKDKHAMHSLNDLETNADKLKKARSEYVKNPTDHTKKAFEDAKKAAQNDLQSGDDVRKTFNSRMKEKAEVADRNAKERIAREYGVKEEQVKTVGATNTMDTSGKADPRGFAKKNAGAQRTTGTEAGKYTEKEINIGEVDGKKVSYDIDKTYRVQVGEYVDPKTGVRTPIYKDIPASETKRIFGEEYYKQFHDGKLPMKLDKDGKNLIVDNDAVNKFSKEMDVSAVDHTSAEGYGGGDFDLKEMLKKDGSVKKLNDLEAGTKTIEFKANEWENQAAEVREHFGDLAKAESWSEESMRQTTKQFNNQILEQVKAKNLENMAKGKNPLEVPDDLFTAIKVMEKVGKPQGGISAVEAEKILKSMGLTPKKVSEEVSSIFESMQKFKD